MMQLEILPATDCTDIRASIDQAHRRLDRLRRPPALPRNRKRREATIEARRRETVDVRALVSGIIERLDATPIKDVPDTLDGLERALHELMFMEVPR